MKRSFLNVVFPHASAIVSVALLLAACAGLQQSGGRPAARASAQPLARLQIPPPAADRDVLSTLLSGEFALAGNDLEAASKAYLSASARSDDAAVAERATRLALAAKNWDRAHQALTRWQALQPDDAGVSQARAQLALNDGQPDAAFDDLMRLAHEPDGNGWRGIAQTLLGATDRAQAAGLLERLALPELLGNRAETWIAVSQLAFKLGRKPLAQKLADQVLARFKGADGYAWAAQLKLDAGDKAGAKALFADALKRDEKNMRLRIAFASLLGDLGENSEAARILANGPQDDYTYAARAAYTARANDKALTSALYQELKGLPTPVPGPRAHLLGQLAELTERKAEALAWYQQVSEDDEHWFEAQVRTAVLLDETGKPADALSLVHELQARAADDSNQLGQAFLLEAELLGKHQRDAAALEAYERGLKALPDDTRLLYARSLVHETLGNLDAAERDLRRVVAIKPDDADALNALGYTLADRTNRTQEALELIQKALLLKPDEAAIIDSMGWVQYRLGHFDEAVKQLRRAFGKQPDPEIAAHLGEVLWVSGQKDEAKRVWDQGRNKDAKNKTLLETIKRLSS